MYLTQKEQNKIKEKLNPEGSNFKDINFIKLLNRNGNTITIEVGYWITYIGYRPKYNKEIITMNLLIN